MIVGVRRDGISFGVKITPEFAAWESKVLMLEIQPPRALIDGSLPLPHRQFSRILGDKTRWSFLEVWIVA